ncbi:MAG: phage holin family protein [Candidatus Promineifilaceae bacterium]|jgi:putative membrane protein
MDGILGLLIGIIAGALISGFVIWIVSKLGLGLEVDGFVSAFIAAIIIAVVGGIINWLLGVLGISVGGGWLGAIIHLIIAAIVLMISDRFLKGLRVAGFVGALIAAVSIGVVYWLLGWLVSLVL